MVKFRNTAALDSCSGRFQRLVSITNAGVSVLKIERPASAFRSQFYIFDVVDKIDCSLFVGDAEGVERPRTCRTIHRLSTSVRWACSSSMRSSSLHQNHQSRTSSAAQDPILLLEHASSLRPRNRRVWAGLSTAAPTFQMSFEVLFRHGRVAQSFARHLID